MLCCCFQRAVQTQQILTSEDVEFIGELVKQLILTRFEPGSHSWYVDSEFRVVIWERKTYLNRNTICVSPYGINKPLEWDDSTFDEMHSRLERVCLEFSETVLKKLGVVGNERAVIVAACIVAAEMVDEISVEFNFKCPVGQEVFGLSIEISKRFSKEILALSLC